MVKRVSLEKEMDTYFFDNPKKAIIKGSFLLTTYMGSILFKQFSVTVVLPTVFIYFLSNMSDYIELAFMKEDKVKTIRYWALGIFMVMLFTVIITFCLYTTDNPVIQAKVNSYYGIFYILCIGVWFIPIFDGVRGQCDKIRTSSVVIEQQLHSDRAYTVMHEGTTNIGYDRLSQDSMNGNQVKDT